MFRGRGHSRHPAAGLRAGARQDVVCRDPLLVIGVPCLARCLRLPDSPDSLGTRAAQEGGLRPQDRVPAADARAGCPARGPGPLQRPHRPGDRAAPGHRPHLVRPFRRSPAAGPGRSQALRAPSRLHTVTNRPGQGPGLPTARRERHTAFALVGPEAGPRGRRPRASPARSPPPPCGAGSSDDALKPWQYQSWIFITDPAFRPKAERVLDLYARTWDGRAARRGRVRDQRGREDLHPGPLPPHPAPGQARPMRVNHTYDRGGALAYLAAYDVHHAKCSAAANPAPASSRSWTWSPRS